MKRITDLDRQPQIGQHLLVPTLREMPIVPTIHADDGLDQPHVHVDMRFVKLVEQGVWHAKRSNGDLVVIRSPDVLPHEVGPKTRMATVLMCDADEQFREVGFICAQVHEWRSNIAFSGATNTAVKPTCRNGRQYCPHRGADVTGLKPYRSGFARCPLHGQLLDLRGVK